MTTFTVTVDDRVASLIRRVAMREQKDETLAATQLLEWAANRRGTEGGSTGDTPAKNEDWDDTDTPSFACQQQQIRQIFERNEW